MNTDIIEISELKWTGMSEFNSDDHCTYYCGKESLRRNGVGLIVNKRVQMQYLDSAVPNAILKQIESSQFISKQITQHHSNPSLFPNTEPEEAEVEQFCEDLQDFLELTPKKDVLFIIGDSNAKIGNQEMPGVTGKFGLGVQNEAWQRPTEFCQENTPAIANILFQ